MSTNSPDQDLDLSMLYDIADGSNEFIVESIELFLTHTPQLLESIATGIANRNWTVVAADSHKLKPNLGFFGMPLCESIVQQVELMAKASEPDTATISLKFNEVYAILTANFVALKKIVDEIGE
jgi:HPt (histidine-containing phosphotransfer) domain-containing protein